MLCFAPPAPLARAASRVVTASFVAVLAIAAAAPATAQQRASVTAADIDAVFADYASTRAPGCTVAISEDGQMTHSRAYGMADLEHRVVNTPDTILEPGSVSKQFTAAATILLALDGLINLDDDIRTYIPELPDYGEVITIRQLLNHTSGLRDWGSVASIAGWPRTTRTHTHKHMLDIASRQLSLNYPPGTHYSYTNTGYNLQAVLVERVSGQSFADFSRERIFEPLGMTNTSWRDDYTRIVPGRATAYRPRGTTFVQNMPFENVHGNGGLLTTTPDLLLFTHALESGGPWGAEFKEEMHRKGVLNNGLEITYASGIVVGQMRGVTEVRHSGATAGYRGYSTRFPDHGLAIAVMCNTAGANAGRLSDSIAELYLGEVFDAPASDPEPVTRIPRDRLQMMSGRFRNTRNNAQIALQAAQDGLRGPWGTVVPETGTRFLGRGGRTVEFSSDDQFTVIEASGDSLRFERVTAWDPDEAELARIAGTYHSSEAEVTYILEPGPNGLRLVDRYGDGIPVAPMYEDAFRSGVGILRVERDRRGAVQAIRLTQSRVWDLRFERMD